MLLNEKFLTQIFFLYSYTLIKIHKITIFRQIYLNTFFLLDLKNIKMNEEDILFETDGWGYTFLETYNFLEGCSLYLREIELQINENIDSNNEKHKIQSLFKKFEDFERHLDYILEYDVKAIKIFREKLKLTELKEEEKVHFRFLIEKCKINLNSALEIKKRQQEVEKRLRELGIYKIILFY
jgi:hypothetical protein